MPFPRPLCEAGAFWNERSCDAPLKLVQRGIIHHVRHCQQGAAAVSASPSSASHNGVTGGRIAFCNLPTLRFARGRWHKALPSHFTCIWNSVATVAAILEAALKILPQRVYAVLTPRVPPQTPPEGGEQSNRNVSSKQKLELEHLPPCSFGILYISSHAIRICSKSSLGNTYSA